MPDDDRLILHRTNATGKSEALVLPPDVIAAARAHRVTEDALAEAARVLADDPLSTLPDDAMVRAVRAVTFHGTAKWLRSQLAQSKQPGCLRGLGGTTTIVQGPVVADDPVISLANLRRLTGDDHLHLATYLTNVDDGPGTDLRPARWWRVVDRDGEALYRRDDEGNTVWLAGPTEEAAMREATEHIHEVLTLQHEEAQERVNEVVERAVSRPAYARELLPRSDTEQASAAPEECYDEDCPGTEGDVCNKCGATCVDPS